MTGSNGELAGKVALVTGGSRGLGLAIAGELARCGADLVIASRKLAACQEAAARIQGEHGRRVLPLACNVGDWDQCNELVATIRKEVGTLDVLINNAGMSPRYPSLEEVSEALYDKVLGVNLKGPFRLSTLLGSDMANGNGGSIVNISSTVSIRPTADTLPYAIAKSGLNTMTEGLAQALAPKVRVNGIIAGPFRTDIAASWSEEATARMTRMVALRRLGEPDEIVGAVMYLVSARSSYCTGALLRLDGGVR